MVLIVIGILIVQDESMRWGVFIGAGALSTMRIYFFDVMLDQRPGLTSHSKRCSIAIGVAAGAIDMVLLIFVLFLIYLLQELASTLFPAVSDSIEKYGIAVMIFAVIFFPISPILLDRLMSQIKEKNGSQQKIKK